MRIRVVGTDLPGTGGRLPGVRVGVQNRKEMVDDVPADVESVTFEVDVTVVPGVDTYAGGLDFRGPCVHGPRGERFLYLVWTHPDADGQPVMFRRAKLQLGPVGELLSASGAEAPGVIGRLGLTDAKGGPVCASVRPPAIQWELSRD